MLITTGDSLGKISSEVGRGVLGRTAVVMWFQREIGDWEEGGVVHDPAGQRHRPLTKGQGAVDILLTC